MHLVFLKAYLAALSRGKGLGGFFIPFPLIDRSLPQFSGMPALLVGVVLVKRGKVEAW